MKVGRTVDGEPVFDEIAKGFVTHFGVVFEIFHDVVREEAFVGVLKGLREIPVEQGLSRETSLLINR